MPQAGLQLPGSRQRLRLVIIFYDQFNIKVSQEAMKQLEDEESTDEEEVDDESEDKAPEEKFYDICKSENEKNVCKS